MEENSPQEIYPGLYVLATPLGNLSDISQRALLVLKSSNLVAAEDTRRTSKLLNYFEINTALISYREQNHNTAWRRLERSLKEGGIIALVSDAGTPIISDPGSKLVSQVRNIGYPVYPIPGPSAVTAALSVSGFNGTNFTFGGFLPPRSSRRKKYLESFKNLPHPLIFFLTPHKLEESLVDFLEVLGPRPAFLAREMTKLHEEYLALPLDAMLEEVFTYPRKGEITLVVEGYVKPQASDLMEGSTLEENILKTLMPYRDEIISDNHPVKEIARKWAETLNLPKKEVYSLVTLWRQEK
jgi:16S rRNA (cytidine1402-2'-O)-methyltransferase